MLTFDSFEEEHLKSIVSIGKENTIDFEKQALLTCFLSLSLSLSLFLFKQFLSFSCVPVVSKSSWIWTLLFTHQWTASETVQG